MSRAEEAGETVWLDVSLLMTGNLQQPAGILRTSAHLFQAWWRRGFTNFRLCRIDMQRGGYALVPPEELLSRFGPPSLPVVSVAERPRGRLALRAARRLARALLPQAVQALLRPMLQAPLIDFGPRDLLIHLG